jgi:hypothetical protein
MGFNRRYKQVVGEYERFGESLNEDVTSPKKLRQTRGVRAKRRQTARPATHRSSTPPRPPLPCPDSDTLIASGLKSPILLFVPFSIPVLWPPSSPWRPLQHGWQLGTALVVPMLTWASPLFRERFVRYNAMASICTSQLTRSLICRKCLRLITLRTQSGPKPRSCRPGQFQKRQCVSTPDSRAKSQRPAETPTRPSF